VSGPEEGLVEDSGQQGLAGGEVAVDRAAGHAGGLRTAPTVALCCATRWAAAWVIAAVVTSPVRPLMASWVEGYCYHFVT
jgi:hypothetical protein